MGEAMDNGTAAQAGAGSPEAAGAATESPEVVELRAALVQAEENLKQQREQYLRAVAEADNIRKRAQRDIESAHRYALERFAAELLPVRDSLELAVSNGTQSDLPGVLAGQEATLKLLERAFDRYSIKRIDPTGERFDPALHEAMLMQASPQTEPNTVLQTVQSGYELNGRLLRPARVVVATAPAASGSGK